MHEFKLKPENHWKTSVKQLSLLKILHESSLRLLVLIDYRTLMKVVFRSGEFCMLGVLFIDKMLIFVSQSNENHSKVISYLFKVEACRP